MDKDNIKALYRSAKACSEIEQLDLAEDTITHALKIEPTNASLKELRTEILKRKGIVEEKSRIANAAAEQKFSEERLLKQALKVYIALT
jgi:predicted Zn-dependent protease